MNLHFENMIHHIPLQVCSTSVQQAQTAGLDGDVRGLRTQLKKAEAAARQRNLDVPSIDGGAVPVMLVLAAAVSVMLDVRADSRKVSRSDTMGKMQYGMDFNTAWTLLAPCASCHSLYMCTCSLFTPARASFSPCYRSASTTR
jgi:hypothetical protein